MRKIIISLFSISFILIIVLTCFLFLYPKYFNKNDFYIPSLSGLNINEAIKLVDELEYEIIYEYSNNEKETVINTFPKENSVVKEDSLIKIYVSQGNPIVGNYIGLNYYDSKELIDCDAQRLGAYVEIINEDSNMEEGYIIDQYPSCDEIVDEKIVLYISINKNMVNIPDFSGWHILDVKDFEEENGLNFTYVYEAYGFMQDYVIRQSYIGRMSRVEEIVIYVIG